MKWFRQLQTRIDFPVSKPVGKISVSLYWLRDLAYLLSAGVAEQKTSRCFELILAGFKPTVFLDVGANIGDYSWRMTNASAETRILMFEPDARNGELLKRTIVRNKLDRVTLHQVAVSDRTGELEFFVDNVSGTAGSTRDYSANSGSLHVAYQMSEKRVVRCVDLDSFMEMLRGQRVVIKIDVEGAESSVLNGARRILREVRPIFLIECFDRAAIAWLSDDGYVIRDLNEGENYLVYPEELKEKIEKGWVRDLI